VIARRLRRRCPQPNDRWHLDEMVARIAGKRMYLWRAADHEGEVLDMLAQRNENIFVERINCAVHAPTLQNTGAASSMHA
jgi:transposase-like protein